MPSSKTRGQIVSTALKLAGRGQELKTLAESCLNSMLRAWAFEKRYPELRKVGAEQTLSAGSWTLSLPADIGAGIDHIMLGNERTSVNEIEMDEFIDRGFYQQATPTTGRPMVFCTDIESGLIRFNCCADQAYSVIPVYFKLPDDIPEGGSNDNDKVWMANDDAVIQGLIEYIYQYTGDDREGMQSQKAEAKKGSYRRGTIGSGVARLQLSRNRFRRI